MSLNGGSAKTSNEVDFVAVANVVVLHLAVDEDGDVGHKSAQLCVLIT
jgi:hypothetical protein